MLPTIVEECSQFLKDSRGHYLIKNLPKNYQGFAKVKVRLKKHKTDFGENFNKAFEMEKTDLHQRAIFAYSNISFLPKEHKTEPFFIFPINGYEVIFNPVIKNSEKDYTLYDNLNINDELVADQLRMSYQSGNLMEAIQSNCEIVIYGIPYYYAIRSSLIEDYISFYNA